MSEELKQIVKEIGDLGTYLDETRKMITDLKEDRGNLKTELTGELEERQKNIIDDLVPKIMEHQTFTRLQKNQDELKSKIDRLNVESVERGIDPDMAKRAFFDQLICSTTIGGEIREDTRKFITSDAYIAETRRLQEDTGWKGGIFVPIQFETELQKLANDEDPLPSICRQVTIQSSNSISFPKRTSLPTAYRTGETGTGTESQSEYAEQVITAHPLTVLTKASVDLEADFSLLQTWIAQDAGEAMGLKMGEEIISGSAGIGLEGVITGGIGAVAGTETVPNTITSTDFAKMYTTLKTKYRANSTFCFNSNSLGVIMKMTLTSGEFVWTQSMADGPQSTVAGRPYILCESMDDQGSGNVPVFLGDWQKCYFVVRRAGINVLRDPYSGKPNIEYLFRMRNGGAVVTAEAGKMLTM